MSTMYLPLYGAGAAQNEGEDPELKRLRSAHVVYQTLAPVWEFCVSAYEGGRDFVNSKNIFKHSRENQEDYEARLSRAHNLNYCEPIVDFFTNFIYAKPIERNGGSHSDWFQQFCADVNLRGDSIDQFFREVSDDAQIYGLVHILADTTKTTEVALTKYDEEVQGVRPYWVKVTPDEVLDWVTDSIGRYVYLKRRQFTRSMINSSPRNLEVYTEFYPDYTQVTVVDITDQAKPVIIDVPPPVLNPDGRIPIVTIRHKRCKKYPEVGSSFLRDFAFNNRQVNNLTSLIDEFLYRQAFNILVKESDSSIPTRDQEEGIVGTANAMEYPKGANAPQYIAPDAAPAQFIQEERAIIKSEMFSRAAQGLISDLFNGDKASGFSQAQSFSKTQPFISSRADALEKAEQEAIALTLRLLGKTWDGKIKYSDDYTVTSLTDSLTHLLMIVRDCQLPSETFVVEALKDVVRKYEGKIPQDLLAKIDKEIEAFDYKKWAEIQKEALVGKAGQSPTEQQKPKDSNTIKEVAKEADNAGSTNKLKSKD